MLAHEIKNPLSGVRGAAQLLEQEPAGDVRELTRLIVGEVDRICKLVDRFEIFSDRPRIERGPVNIHEVLDHVRRLALSGFARNLRFVQSYDPSLPPVYGNRDLLVQALLNLVKNAIEAAGRLASPPRTVRVSFANEGSEVEARVVDNGPGFSVDDPEEFFQPFVTRRPGGLGMGLTISRTISEAHGGRVSAEAAPGGGALLTVRLPLAAPVSDSRS